MLFIGSANALTLTGQVSHIIDGDTFDLAGQRIRLLGMDTPENAQTCIVSLGKTYSCGDSATRCLKSLIHAINNRCEGDELDAYKRLLATCFSDQSNISKALVRAG